MKNNKIGILILFFSISLLSFSQKAAIKFEKLSHDFGKITEEGGNATYVFSFTNVGNSPLVISNVQASCGCTTPTWTKEPIEPGKKGSITVIYNPLGRPGAFTKSITVHSNAMDEQVVLMIKGDVTPKGTEIPVSIKAGDLRLKTKTIQLNNIDKNKSQTRELEVENIGKENLKVITENLPAHLTATVLPQVLKPNESGKIIITFNASKAIQWGPSADDIYIVINGQRKFSDEFELKVFANVVEDFSKMTLEQKRKAPIFETANRNYDLGPVKIGSRKSVRIKIANKGLSNLEIRRVINYNKEITFRPLKLSIPTGNSGDLIVDMNSKNLPLGDYTKAITLQTNDPDNTYVTINFNWKIQK